MSAVEKLIGAGAVIMAICCAVLPLVGAAIGGGLIAGAGTVGLVVGLVVLAVVLGVLSRRRKAGSRC